MRRLNLKHLRYFWTVVNEGSIARAAETLNLTPQTISGQLRVLEEETGTQLLEKSGRGLAPTATGRMVFAYADDLFRIETELSEVLAGGGSQRARVIKIGVAMVVPKLLAYRLLAPATRFDDPVRLICHEAPLADLLADLAVHRLDMVISDAPLSPALNIRAYNHELGSSPLAFFAAPDLAARLGADFPANLDGAPMLMPSAGSSLYRSLEQWFAQQGVNPRVVAEFEDRALMKVFGEASAGVFTSPAAVADDVREKYRVTGIGAVDAIRETFYAITPERQIRHPALLAIVERGREQVFGPITMPNQGA
ncbi:MAG: transcriptional activator NhaR [Chromatiales bacterium]|nr:transcriptional activator NhaR [Gammaproteobacteria bacterium]MCP5352649.1 transcriptional activator NhaR [Chromatiales bacterium]